MTDQPVLAPHARPDAVHAQLLGEIVIEWSRVTQLLQEMFAQLAGLDDAFVFGVFTEKVKDGQLDDLVRSLAGQCTPLKRDRIHAWIAKVKSAREKRNQYLHVAYMEIPSADGDLRLHMHRRVLDRPNGMAHPEFTKLMRADLEAFRDELVTIQQEFDQLMDWT